MSHPLLPFDPRTPLHSPLLLNPPDTVPPTDELEAVQAELKALKQKSLDRAKKADGDLKAIEVALKKMREKEKGKAKAVTKIKREQSYTPSLDTEERAFSPSAPPLYKASSSSTSIPVIAVSPSLSKASSEIRKFKKKEKDKKRKRELDESDGELESQRPRKFSPLPPSQKETHAHRPSKLGGSSHSKGATGPDWTVPPPHPLLPQRPPIPPPPVAGPSKPVEVTEDFSKAKAPSQVPVNTFYATVEPWLRPIREEDVGWLEYSADEVEPYVIPQLGRHYTEVWEDEDVALYGGVPAALDFSLHRNSASHSGPHSGSLPKWDPSTMTEGDLVSEKGHGPVTERLVTALLPAPDMAAWKHVKEAEDLFEARPVASGSHGGTLGKEKMNVADFEERARDTARFHGLLDGELDFSQTLDDPISTALRQAQRQLRIVVATNEARKARLVEIAQDRLAYQEYVELRESIDKNISAAFSKLQKKDGPKVGKKKKKGDMNGAVNGVNGGGVVPPLPHPASTGLGPDEEGKLYVPESLKALVETRRRWVDVLGGAFDEKQAEIPGRIWGVPKSSVFEGVDEEVREQLHSGRTGPHPRGRDGGERTDGDFDKGRDDGSTGGFPD